MQYHLNKYILVSPSVKLPFETPQLQLRQVIKAGQGIGRVISGFTLGLSVSLLAGGKAEAVTFTFTKIADTSTPIPGGTGNFGFYPFFDGSPIPAINNGNVAFTNTRIDEYKW